MNPEDIVYDENGLMQAYTVGELPLSIICHSNDGIYKYSTCLGIVKEGDYAPFDLLISQLLLDVADGNAGQYQMFNSINEATRLVFDLTGRTEVPDNCVGCRLPSDFGYFLLFSIDPATGLPKWTLALQDAEAARYIRANSSYSTLRLTANPDSIIAGASRLSAYVFDSMAAMSMAQAIPTLDPVDTPPITSVEFGVVSIGWEPPETEDLFPFSIILMIPLLVAAISSSSAFSYECSITRCVLQAGMHPLPLLIVGLSIILFQTAIILATTFVSWGVFPDTFGLVYNGKVFTFGVGIFLVIVVVVGFLIESAAVFVLIPRRVPAVIIVICLSMFGQGLIMLMQLQSSVWPYYVICALIPSSVAAIAPNAISVFRSLALVSSSGPEYPRYVVSQDWRVGLGDILSSSFPNDFVTNTVLQQASPQHGVIVRQLPGILGTAIGAMALQLVLLYCGYSVRPAEIGGPYSIKRLFALIPRCKLLRQILDEKANEVALQEAEHGNQGGVGDDKSQSTGTDVSVQEGIQGHDAQHSDIFAKVMREVKGRLESSSGENGSQLDKLDTSVETKRRHLGLREKIIKQLNNREKGTTKVKVKDGVALHDNEREEIEKSQDINLEPSKEGDNTQLQNNSAVQGRSPLTMMLSPNRGRDQLSPLFDGEQVVMAAEGLVKEYKMRRKEGQRLMEIENGRIVLKHNHPKRYSFLAVNNVSVTFKKGTTTGVIGENGAGKTTLLRMIMGTETATEGKIEMLGGLFGKNSGTGPLDILPLIGYVPQHDILGKFTCKLHCIIMAQCRGLKLRESKMAADEALELVGLQGKANCIATTLSGGQKRRLMVAMALCGGPPILILDEPEAGLSVDAKEELDESLRRVKTSDVSIVMTEHDMSQIEELCDEVVVLKGGNVVTRGTPLELKDEHAGYTLRVSFDKPDAERSHELLNALSSYTETTIKHANGKDVTYSLSSDAIICIEDIAKTVEVTEGVISYGIRTTTLGDAIRDIIGENEEQAEPPTNIDHRDSSYASVLNALLRKTTWSLMRNKVTFKCFLDILVVFVMCGIFAIFIPELTRFLIDSGGYVSVSNDPAVALALGPVRWAGDSGGLMVNWPESVEFPLNELARQLSEGTTPIIVFTSPTSVTIYSPPISVIPTILQSAILANLEGLRRGIEPTVFSTGGELRSFTTDEVFSILPLLSWVIPLFAVLCSLAVASLAVVVPYFLVFERVNGFEGLTRLTGRRRGINTLAWTLCSIIPYSIINFGVTFLVAMIIAWRISSENLTVDFDSYVNYSLVTGGCAAVSQLTWAFIGILISYKYRSTNTVLHASPHMLWLMLVPFIISATFMSLGTENMSPYEANNFWSNFLWVFGIFPPSCCETLLTNLLLFGFIPSVFTVDINQAFIILGVNVVIAVLMFALVFVREGISQGYYKHIPKSLNTLICLGSSMSNDVAQPTERDRKLRGYTSSTLPEESEYKHPMEEDNVNTERLRVRELVDKGAIEREKSTSIQHVKQPKKQPNKNTSEERGGDDNCTDLHVDKVDSANKADVLSAENPEQHKGQENQENQEEDGGSGEANTDMRQKYAALFHCCRREFKVKLPDKSSGVIAAVRCLDIVVQKGECLGLVGENGAGKSTALSMAIGNISPSFGTASLLVRRVGYVPQTNAHCPWLTVEQHVKLFAKLGGVSSEDAFRVASFVGLNKHMAKRPSQLSGGYKRRLSLAIALITSTEMLVADEVAAGVDESARYSILSLMDSLKDAGCSVIMTSHDMDAVDRITNRVAVLVKGRLRALDTPEMLKRHYGGGLVVSMQLKRANREKALMWLLAAVGCEESEIVEVAHRGNEVKFMVPNDTDGGIVRIMSLLSPTKRPPWITRADVNQASLQSAFLKFEAEARDLGLDNIVPLVEQAKDTDADTGEENGVVTLGDGAGTGENLTVEDEEVKRHSLTSLPVTKVPNWFDTTENRCPSVKYTPLNNQHAQQDDSTEKQVDESQLLSNSVETVVVNSGNDVDTDAETHPYTDSNIDNSNDSRKDNLSSCPDLTRCRHIVTTEDIIKNKLKLCRKSEEESGSGNYNFEDIVIDNGEFLVILKQNESNSQEGTTTESCEDCTLRPPAHRVMEISPTIASSMTSSQQSLSVTKYPPSSAPPTSLPPSSPDSTAVNQEQGASISTEPLPTTPKQLGK